MLSAGATGHPPRSAAGAARRGGAAAWWRGTAVGAGSGVGFVGLPPVGAADVGWAAGAVGAAPAVVGPEEPAAAPAGAVGGE
jgi:hypothetical protein